ncbi:peptidase-like protein [Ketogulonicigenium robustum]|uniref:Peptidase-like protein n=1 Tax=Ketogulonicigenium robustum TaxID=92947 RepID=A0A1W6P1Q0_9RHOB|nr:DVUA0089 family protein [Ketogulonicigenium robustum]ARO15369.1 peptidase-like protein [Ketogulonicigenium robustum]
MRAINVTTGLKRLGIGAALALGTALPAYAQDAVCGTAAAGGQWLGGAADTSNLGAISTPFDQMALIMSGGQHVSYFSVDGTTDVRLEAESSDGGDPMIDLYDASGALVGSDDDSGGALSARLEQSLPAGNYCMVVRTFDGSGTTAYVRAGRTEMEALTAGTTTDDWSAPGITNGTCTFATATMPFGNGAVNARLSEGGVSASATPNDTPNLGFTLSEPTALTVTATNTTADPVLAIYDENGAWLAENDDFDGLNSRIDFVDALPAGNYCIELSAYNDGSLPIDVKLSTYDPAAAMVGMYERGEASPPLDGSYPITAIGELPARYRTDVQAGSTATWFSFDVTQAGVVAIEAVANGAADPVLILFDDFGRQVSFADDSENSLDPKMVARVSTGTYLVALKLYESNSRAPVRMLFEHFVPAK